MTTYRQELPRGALFRNIARLQLSLCHVIDHDHGLLSKLRSVDVLTDDQVKLVRSQPTDVSAIEQLLEFVIQLSSSKLEQFLTALCETQQAHASNFIISNGHPSSEGDENWPIAASDKFRLILSGCINAARKRRIELSDSCDGKFTLLLTILKRRSFSDFTNSFPASSKPRSVKWHRC
jgi:hypothetical protein